MRRYGAQRLWGRRGWGGMAGVQSVPRVMYEPVPRGGRLYEVPLSQRKLGDDVDIEMPEECIRPGEVFISPGVCGPPASVDPVTVRVPISTTKTPPASAATATKPSMTNLLILGGLAVAAIYFLGKR